jgi:hypothetical protein
MLNTILSDDALVAAFDDPAVMAAVNEVSKDPTAFQKHAGNPKASRACQHALSSSPVPPRGLQLLVLSSSLSLIKRLQRTGFCVLSEQLSICDLSCWPSEMQWTWNATESQG